MCVRCQKTKLSALSDGICLVGNETMLEDYVVGAKRFSCRIYIGGNKGHKKRQITETGCLNSVVETALLSSVCVRQR